MSTGPYQPPPPQYYPPPPQYQPPPPTYQPPPPQYQPPVVGPPPATPVIVEPVPVVQPVVVQPVVQPVVRPVVQPVVKVQPVVVHHETNYEAEIRRQKQAEDECCLIATCTLILCCFCRVLAGS